MITSTSGLRPMKGRDVPVKPRPVLDRMADKFLVGDGCWEWTAVRNSFGYGVIHRLDAGSRLAHRVLFEAMVGPVPDGMDLDHLCRNRGCVRPSHLEIVSRRVNIMRGEMPQILKERGQAKTHCPAGHSYADQERYRRKDGSRRCMECERIAARARRSVRAS